MSDKPPERKDGPLEFLSKFVVPFLSFVLLMYGYYTKLLGDWEAVTYITAGSGLLVLISILARVGFKPHTSTLERVGTKRKKRSKKTSTYTPTQRIAQFSLLFILAFLILGGEVLILRRMQKLVVLVATFEGPEDVYGLHNQIVDELNTSFSNNPTVEILPVSNIVFLDQGRSYARALGKRHLADIVIWGWYRPIQNQNVDIHIEILSPQFTSVLNPSTILSPPVTLTDLDTSTFQQQLSGETTALINFLAGLIQYGAEDDVAALAYFNKSLSILENSTSPLITNQFPIYFFRGTVHNHLRKYDQAVADLSKAIQLNSDNASAYNNRGSAYSDLNQYDQAIADSTKAIQLDPKEPIYYANRAINYLFLNEYDLAIADSTKAIQIDPQSDFAYDIRGNAYFIRKNFELAFTDYSKSIDLNPDDAMPYYHRGMIYSYRGQHGQAIADYSKAIKLDPKFAEAYSNRGVDYGILGQHGQAIADYTIAIKLNPQFAPAYINRSTAYEALGKTAEAEVDAKKYEELTGQKP